MLWLVVCGFWFEGGDGSVHSARLALNEQEPFARPPVRTLYDPHDVDAVQSGYFVDRRLSPGLSNQPDRFLGPLLIAGQKVGIAHVRTSF